MHRKSKDPGIYQLQLRASRYQIISLDSSVCGALIFSDADNPGEYLVVDSVDTDIFL